MAQIRSIDSITSKWVTVTPERSGVYKAGVENPLRDWKTETLLASSRRDEGMRKAIADGRINRGITKAGTPGWQDPAKIKGPQRWSEGVSLGGPKYSAGFGPYRDEIERVKLPEKYAKGDPRNWDRSKAIGIALHNKKIKG